MSETATIVPAEPVVSERRPVFDRLTQAYNNFARRELLACGFVLFLTLAIRALLYPVFPVPPPASHDEFSYLLAADTYSSGRLANPPHPFWQHFETFHELMQPTYASKYPIAQGMVLAFGQKFFREPWIGVYLSAGLMCAAMCWMLQAWITPGLALLGAILFMLRIGIFSSWMNSYWGGAIAAIGGCLVLGSFARIVFRRQPAHVITFAGGLVVLMHSRPWEGGVLAIAALGILTSRSKRWTPEFRRACLRSAIPAAAILLVSVGALAYVDYRVTGNALAMPHMLYDRQYLVAPLFTFQSLRPAPEYRHEILRSAYTGWHAGIWRAARYDALNTVLSKLSDLYKYFFGFWPLLVPALLWPYPLKSQAEKLTVLLLLVFLAVAVVPLTDLQPHYVAPVVCLFYLRFLQTLARLYDWRPFGAPVGWAVGVFFVTLFPYQFADTTAYFVRYRPPVSAFTEKRAAVLDQLERQPGKQLVLVRYTPAHDFRDEWVYNRADIDASPIVWAHEMGPPQDVPFLDYFHGRQVWLLEADATPPRLIPYAERLPGEGGR